MKISSSELWGLLFSAIFVQNLVMVYMLWSSKFYKALRSPATCLIFGCFITVATTVCSALAWLVNHYLLLQFKLDFLAPLSYVFIIVLAEVAAELLLMKFRPQLRERMGSILPSSAFNCAVLGLLFINIKLNGASILPTVFYGFCAGLGFILALFITANAIERARYSAPPSSFRGLPISLITAGLISLGFMGFAGAKLPF